MPELPEVETTRRGVEPWVVGRTLKTTRTYQSSLRWPIEAPKALHGANINGVYRRGKYLLFGLDLGDDHDNGTLIVHLGMSGSLRVLAVDTPRLKHDHFELVVSGPRKSKSAQEDKLIRLNDPRRFGCVLYQSGNDPKVHPLLAHLGVEPLGNEFSGEYLFQLSRRRKLAVKNFIMDSKIVVGVGNIYAAESLFQAGIRPTVPAGKVTRQAYEDLSQRIRGVLADAIRQGGTTLRDFVGSDGKPGYFKQSLYVYGREGEPCQVCATRLKGVNIGNRSSVYCPTCQRHSSFQPPI
ncbi:MAG: bifunctional DNA-formamidopyrimidine glycosylase/DNA-(apurinic or apyrimidinic site) lyase [Pseudomonadales bacterium]|nr:bifunctional DNA-formamidopyrimidine glycosylase/DNA-(apurinic or apyrimidinic site) lyase [Pseudomonadales bacterium]